MLKFSVSLNYRRSECFICRTILWEAPFIDFNLIERFTFISRLFFAVYVCYPNILTFSYQLWTREIF